MQLRCPCCGAAHSLDALVAHDDARAALVGAFALSGPLGRDLIRYLALHRPAQRELSMARVARLIGELAPDIERQAITRERRTHHAPPELWRTAIAQVLQARDAGRLKLPLQGHGYLYAILAGLAADPAAAAAAAHTPEAQAHAQATQAAAIAAAAAFKDDALLDIERRRATATPPSAEVRAKLAAARAALSTPPTRP